MGSAGSETGKKGKIESLCKIKEIYECIEVKNIKIIDFSIKLCRKNLFPSNFSLRNIITLSLHLSKSVVYGSDNLRRQNGERPAAIHFEIYQR
jgi:hypothetical protein